MKNIITLILFVLIVGAGFKHLNVEDYRVNTVVIDAGHGGKDPGCHGKVAKEADVALKVALQVGALIKENSPTTKVIYTRADNHFIELHERAKKANSKGADLFISIHCNAGPSTAFGTEVYAMGLHKEEGNLNVAKRENAVILKEDNYLDKYEGFDPNSPISHILLANMQSVHLESSLSLASEVDKQFTSIAKKSRGVKQAGFLVLWKTTMPSILIELGFLTNTDEEKNLNSLAYQKKMANGIYHAFASYKKSKEF
ncbi:MAG: N-acetylmuramoyl-L-alanine amidase [Cyclobacteriaceae bacterium]